MGDDGVVIGMSGARIRPRADVDERSAAVGAPPQVDAADDHELRIGRIARPDYVVVPALLAQIGRRLSVWTLAGPLLVFLAAVARAPDFPLVHVDGGVDRVGVGERIGQLDTPRPSSGRGELPARAAVSRIPSLS